MEIRIQKFLSESGIASRRKAEEFIISKQVQINGKLAKLGDKINPKTDTVKVYGKVIQFNPNKIYLAMNKPKNYVVSKKDPRHRKTVFDLLPKDLRSQVWNIGRLDYETEGLLIFTNDGELTQQLSHPSFEHEKEYEILTDQPPTPTQLEKLKSGVEISSGLTYPAKLKTRGNTIFLTIHEGKKRQIRRMLDAVNLPVISLKRIRVNKLRLPSIAPGQFITVAKTDIL